MKNRYRKIKIRCWKLEDRSWRLDCRNWRLEIRNRKLVIKCKSNRYLPTSNYPASIAPIYSVLMVLSLLLPPLSIQAQSLNDYLKIAAKNNPALKSKFATYQASLEKVNQIGALPNPTLDFGYFISPIETRTGPQQGRIGIMQMFPWKGTLNAQEQVYADIAKANYELFESAKKRLFYQVKKEWYELYELEQSITIIEENLKILESYEVLATKKFETGSKKGMVDVLRIQMKIAELANKVLLFKDKLKANKVAFNNRLNQPPTNSVLLPNKQEVLTIVKTKGQLNNNILSSNNELKSMEMKKNAVESSVIVAQKQGLPMIGVGLNYFVIGESDMVVSNSGRDAIMPMVSVGIPIYRKKYRAQKTEAQLKVEGVDFQLKNKENELNTQLEMDWLEYEDARRRVKLYNDQNKKAGQALEILIKSYTNSGNDFEEILRVQEMMISYDLQLLKAAKDNNVAVAKIQSLM